MIFTQKTRHKSTKHCEITSSSRVGSRTTTCSSMWQHYRNPSALKVACVVDMKTVFMDRF